MKCPYCTANIKKAKFCQECGKELSTGLTQDQKKYLQKRKTAHKVGAVAGGLVGGTGVGLGIFGIIIGITLIIAGILLSLTIVGAIIGIPMVITGAIILGLGGASTTVGGVATGSAIHSGRKIEEINNQLRGIKK